MDGAAVEITTGRVLLAVPNSRDSRHRLVARLEPFGTARDERASAREVAERRDRALDRAELRSRRSSGDRRQQPARVRMLRIAKQIAHAALFDDASGVH